MLDKVEMSLDDIIAQQKVKGGGGGGAGRKFGGRGRGRGPPRVAGGGVVGGYGPRGRRNPPGNIRAQYNRAAGDIDGRWQHDMYDGPARRGFPPSAGVSNSGKLIVANLDFGVSDKDVTELFSEFGLLKSAAIHYDRSGRSLGIADIVFERRPDAMKALKAYNNVPLDGRPMKIKFADEAPPAFGGGGGRTGGSPGGIRNSGRIQRPQASRPRGGRGGGRGSNNGGRRKDVTAEDLDAELDAWKKAA